MWFQNTEAHYSVFAATQHTELSALRGPGPTAFCLLGLHNRGNDVIQEVREAALQLVTLNRQNRNVGLSSYELVLTGK